MTENEIQKLLLLFIGYPLVYQKNIKPIQMHYFEYYSKH